MKYSGSSACRLVGPGLRCRAAGGRTLAALFAAMAVAGAAAQPQPVVLRVVGGLAALPSYTQHEEPFWAHELERLSGGAARAEIVPFDRAGMRPSEMLRLVQIGAVPFANVLLTSASATDPELAASDLAGQNPDIAALRRSDAAFRPQLARLLRQRYGAELLAVYIYPAQVTFCTRPFVHLSDLAGRRIRVSSPTQADWVAGLNAIPVQTPFADIVANVRAGNIDCAITGTMSGHAIGLHEVTTHVHTMPVSWGVAAFVAHGAAFAALPPAVQALLRRELPRLERDIWNRAIADTERGLACNTGRGECGKEKPGRMTGVPPSPQDERVQRDLFLSRTLPRWVQRCGASCEALWRESMAPVYGVSAPAR